MNKLRKLSIFRKKLLILAWLFCLYGFVWNLRNKNNIADNYPHAKGFAR